MDRNRSTKAPSSTQRGFEGAQGWPVNQQIVIGRVEGGAMETPFASGDWHVAEGREDAFIDAWTAFLTWTSDTQPDLIEAGLVRDEKDAGHFISFARWKDPGSRNVWKNSEGFMQHFSACRSLCDDFHGGDYRQAVAIEGTATRVSG